MIENHLEHSSSRRLVTENMMESIVDERHGGPPDGVGEGDSSPCDAWGGQERAASLCARICTAVCIVGVACACAAVGTFVHCGDGMQRVLCFFCVTGAGGDQVGWTDTLGSIAGARKGENYRAPVLPRFIRIFVMCARCPASELR